MQIPVHDLLLGIREALVIWLVLFTSVLAGIGAFAYAQAPERRTPATGGRRTGSRRTGSSLADQAGELRRYADEVGVAADRAGARLVKAREEWLAALRTQEAAWRAYEAVNAKAGRVIRAAVFPVPTMPETPEELAERERYLRKAATAAYRRGELSDAQLVDALAHRNGWTPRLHPIEQDEVILRHGQHRLLRAYQAVSTVEREAWRATEVAAAGKRSLDEEAYTAKLQAGHAEYRLAARRSRRVAQSRRAPWPGTATNHAGAANPRAA
jgi:hypothetical protein